MGAAAEFTIKQRIPQIEGRRLELPAHQIGKAFLKHLPKQYVSGILSLINLQQINMNFSKKMEKETGCH